MKKKIWIRVLGVVALLAWGFTYLAFHAAATMAHGADRGVADLFGLVCAGVSGFITAVWALFSIIDWTVRRQAKLQARNLAQTFGRAPAAPGPPVPFPMPAAAPAPGVAHCAQCGRPGAQWWCYQHAVELCDTCGGQHRLSFPACTWAQRVAPAPHPGLRPREVKTSALAGIR